MQIKKTLLLIIVVICTVTFKSGAQSWSLAGNNLDNNVFSFANDPATNILYVAGHFDNSGAVQINRVGQWDGTNWLPVGTGMNQDVYTLAIYNGNLYAGGHFTLADGNPCNYIAMWDGLTWQPVGTGMNNDVYYLHVYNGELYAGGIFTAADGNTANRIAKWDGTSWSDVGGGIAGTATPQILSIQVYNNELFVTGQFNDAGGNAVNNIARWNGTAWSDVGGGIAGSLNFGSDLIVYNNNLILTGSYITAGTDTSNGIAKWNGTNWSAIGSGLSGANGYGTVLGVYNGELYVGGNYTSVNGIVANRISRYNEIAGWRDVGAGCDEEVDALESFNGELFVGGTFYNGGNIGALKVARWSSGCTAATVVAGKNVSCAGLCDGAISVSSVGNAPFTYLWSTNDTTGSLANLCPGSYTLTITDSSGCTAVDSATIIEYPLPSLTLSSISPVCPNQCNGSASVSVTGRAPFTYLWSTNPVQVSDTAFNLCAGNYIVVVTDSSGCIQSDSVAVFDPATAALGFTSTLTACNGICNGTATVSTTSINTPYTFLWSTIPAQDSATAINLCAGIYSVTVTDSLGCAVQDSVTIGNPTPFTLAFSITAPTCPLSCNGSASVTSDSPYAPFTYAWNTNPAQSADTAVSLCEGIYTVSITDTVGCITIDSIYVTDPVLTLSVSSINESCTGAGCDGSAIATASGSNLFTYLWSNSEVTDSITNLCAGVYTIIATDAAGCILTDSVQINTPTPPTVTLTTQSPICFGDCNGIINANASGSTSLSYLWSNGETTDSITNACFGWYVVTVSDSLGCTVIDSSLVFEPDELLASPTNILGVTCNGNCDGSINTTTSGGTFPYTYLWSDNGTQPDALNLCADIYTLTVTDAHGCTKEINATVSQPDSLITDITGTDATCHGCNDGTLTVTTVGGTLPYNLFFTPAVPDLQHVLAGTYYVCVTDGNGCQSCDSVVVSEPSGIFSPSASLQKFDVFPNPFRDEAVLKIPGSVVKGENLGIAFYTMQGQEIQTVSYTANKKSLSTEIVIRKGNLESGMYLIKIKNKNEVIGTSKFVTE